MLAEGLTVIWIWQRIHEYWYQFPYIYLRPDSSPNTNGYLIYKSSPSHWQRKSRTQPSKSSIFSPQYWTWPREFELPPFLPAIKSQLTNGDPVEFSVQGMLICHSWPLYHRPDPSQYQSCLASKIWCSQARLGYPGYDLSFLRSSQWQFSFPEEQLSY